MFMFFFKKRLKKKTNVKLLNCIVNYNVESLDFEDGDAGTARDSSTKKLLFEYMRAVAGGPKVQNKGQS